MCIKSQRCLFFLKIGTHSVSRMLALIPTLVFWVSNPKSIFGEIWAKKVKVDHFVWILTHLVSQGCWFLFYYFAWKLAHTHPQSISRMLILILRLLFWNSKPISIFWTNLSQKGWIVYFVFKLVHKISWGCDLRLERKVWKQR